MHHNYAVSSRFFAFALILGLLLSLLTQHTAAQYHGWHYLPNVGLDSTTDRFEDVYFTDTSTGYAVLLSPVINGPRPIYKTMDGGHSWRKSTDYFFHCSSMLRSIEFLDDGITGIVGSLGGTTYRTEDSGHTWTNISSAFHDSLDADTVQGRAICGLSHIGNTFYGVGWWGSNIAKFFRSDDKGITWHVSHLDTNLAWELVDVVFLSADTGFVVGGSLIRTSDSTGRDESVVLSTTDGGATWTKVFSDTTLGGRIWKIQFLDRLHAVASMEPDYFPDTVNMIKSTDGGNTWSVIHAGRCHNSSAYNQGIGFATENIGWMGGYYNGIFETFDGGATWDTLAFGINLNRFFVLDSTHVFAGGQSVYRWGPDTSSTTVTPTPLHPPHDLYPVSPNPADGKVKIAFDIQTETNVLLQVESIDARWTTRIASGVFKPGHYEYYWDGRNRPAGNYLVWLGTDQIPLTEQFVLRH